jgi:hypothetical protein
VAGVVRWRFDDPVSLASYVFEINPNDGGSPDFQKNFSYANTSAADGKTLIYEGRDKAQKFDFSGVILSQAHYDAFVEWWDKRYQVKITDDLGREFYVIIESFTPTRKRSALYPWKHDFKVSATIVNYP